jgi:D-galactarolactone cycloisomerase
MAIKDIAGNCLIRIDTDGGLVGYGEAGATGPMARARIATMKPLLVGKDPLAIEVHFQNMTSLMHTYMAHIPTISGIDIALWDLAGKSPGYRYARCWAVRSANRSACIRMALA